jgi:putative endonuclease
MHYYVYILYSQKLNRYYIGTTDDPSRRLLEHNTQKHKDAYTCKGIPWELMLSYACKTSKSAYDLERFIKRMKSRVFIEKVINTPSILVDIESNL